MTSLFWQRMHGGCTHFPIVLLLASVVFDGIAWRSKDAALRRGLSLAGLGSVVVGLLGGIGAVISGIFISHGRLLGGGEERLHHFCVWPGFTLCLALVIWRLARHGEIPAPALYLALMGLASALMLGAGYWGGEMLLAS